MAYQTSVVLVAIPQDSWSSTQLVVYGYAYIRTELAQLFLTDTPGNLNQLYNPKGLEFHQHLSDRYGGMVKTYGFFGVCRFPFSIPACSTAD